MKWDPSSQTILISLRKASKQCVSHTTPAPWLFLVRLPGDDMLIITFESASNNTAGIHLPIFFLIYLILSPRREVMLAGAAPSGPNEGKIETRASLEGLFRGYLLQ